MVAYAPGTAPAPAPAPAPFPGGEFPGGPAAPGVSLDQQLQAVSLGQRLRVAAPGGEFPGGPAAPGGEFGPAAPGGPAAPRR